MTTLWIVAAFVVLLAAVLYLRKALVVKVTPVVQGAILKQNESITLVLVKDAQWSDPERINRMTRELAAEGLAVAGDYSVDELAVLLRLMVNTANGVTANIHDHPKGGIWAELVTRYEDGSSATATTLPDKGVPRPEWLKTLRLPGASPAQLYRELLRTRPHGPVKIVALGDAAHEFEQTYFTYMAWLKNRQLSAAEVLMMVEKAKLRDH
ncbi:MAG: hypothetical protein NTX64_04385 [Elusimicrobia bacterium]|nr:hypothetical protein [Elusimicrobiota bacterium]